MIKADLHVHTRYSIDSIMTNDQLIKACLKKGIDCIAVADHGTTRGARELSQLNPPLKIIICEEVLTPYGEVMGMFLKENIPDKISLPETLKLIRQQDGLVCIPHPFDRVRPSAFRNLAMLESIADDIDIIEVFNSRSLTPGIEKKARDFAARHNKVISAGTDAHSTLEIGYAHVTMRDFTTKEDFLASLAEAQLYGKKSSPLIHIISTSARLWKKKVV